MYKFPFKSFKEGAWDIEHIDSYTANGLNDKTSQNDWLKSSDDALLLFERERESLKILGNNEEFRDLHERIKKYRELEKKSDEDFHGLYDQIQRIFEEDENDEELKNNIGNLTLLDFGTNRGYGNALFRIKRKIIIEKDREGVFIPIGTKNVFLKYFDTGGISPASWSRADIENYRNDIAKTLKKFLPACQKP
jgi:hypothetical protein